MVIPALRAHALAYAPPTAARVADPRVADLLAHGRLAVLAFEPVPTADPAALWEYGADRRLGRGLHSFFWLRDHIGPLSTLAGADRRRLIDLDQALLTDWHDRFGDRATAPEMAYHDETTAQRVVNLTTWWSWLPEADRDNTAVLRARLEQDIALLLDPDFHAGSNNHGMFQDIALLVSSVLDPWLDEERRRTCMRVGAQRLEDYFRSCFTADGVHIENTPTYHLMICRQVGWVARFAELSEGAIDPTWLHTLISAGERYAAHALTPARRYPPVSDTTVVDVRSGPGDTAFGEGWFRYATTLGAEGTAPGSRTFVSEVSGYAIHRSSWTDARASHTFFCAAYNSDYHKHSDELSVHVVADGRALLSDAGANGYDYDSPFTKYGYSSRAHNSLLVDGAGLRRIDTNAHLTTLRDLGSTPDTLDVEGRTLRHPGVDWRRRLQVPSSGARGPIVLTDTVRADRPRQLTFVWHTGPQVRAIAEGEAIHLYDGLRRVAELTHHSDAELAVRHLRGATEPHVQGWFFPKMGQRVPTDAFEYTVGADAVDITWTLRTRSFTTPEPGTIPDFPHRLTATPNGLSVSVDAPAGTLVSFRVHVGREVVARRGYAPETEAAFALPGGTYRVRVYVQDPETGVQGAFTTARITLSHRAPS